MTDWTSGYVADINYTSDFFREMAPTHLGFCALAGGHDHALNQPGMTYCELGCGQGFTANLLAAANPQVEFHAMDFNPSHMAGADRLARDAGLDNMFFYERSFEDFAEAPGLPDQFDVIALHGVFSWVSRDHQETILDFIGQRLKPGGLVYISYNTLPGWAPVLPLRRLLANHGSQDSGPLADRISRAMDYVRGLEQSGAGYFAANPALSKKLDQMQTMPANYLAHEYFNRDWTPFHFEDIAADMARAKLKFLAPAEPRDMIDEISLQPDQLALLQGETDPVLRQSLRDVLLNEQFRTDVFVKGKLPHTERGSIGAWFATPLALTRPYGGGTIKLSWRIGEIRLDKSAYAPVLTALRAGPLTVRELLDIGAFGQMSWGEIARLLTALIGGGFLAPALPAEGLAERADRCRAFNLAVAKRAEDSEVLQFFASPVTGSGIALDRFEQLFLLARSEGHDTPDSWAELVWQILAPQGQRLQQDGRVLETPEENLAVLRVRAAAFAARRLPLCESLGLTLEPGATPPASRAAA